MFHRFVNVKGLNLQPVAPGFIAATPVVRLAHHRPRRDQATTALREGAHLAQQGVTALLYDMDDLAG